MIKYPHATPHEILVSNDLIDYVGGPRGLIAEEDIDRAAPDPLPVKARRPFDSMVDKRRQQRQNQRGHTKKP